MSKVSIGLKNTVMLAFAACMSMATVPSAADAPGGVLPSRPEAPLLASYEQLLPLEGGSNFRDLGGYQTEDGRVIRRGLLFRSGGMANLTAADEAYLSRFGFSSVVDLRSQEELELFPNRWVTKDSDIEYVNVRYSFRELAPGQVAEGGLPRMEAIYRNFPSHLQPQLKSYFRELLEGDGAVVVNCSAGQDRTGFASAMVLSALGVPRDVILADYLLSTQYRRPDVEMKGVDLKEAAKSNGFAKLMLKYADQESSGPKPLLTRDGEAYLKYAFVQIDEQYGSVAAYLDTAIGIDDADIAALKKLYLE